MKNKRYYGINIAVFLLTIFFFLRMALENFIWFRTEGTIKSFFLLCLLNIVMIHIIKALRLYFLMLETRPTVTRFLRTYIKTTLVNLVLPFKLGEFFRMYCFGHELKNYKTGILLILTDRYFDTIPLVIILLGFIIFGKESPRGVIITLVLFLLVVTILYSIFPSTFRYMNRFLIMNTNSDRGIQALELLKKMQHWYSYIQELIIGREIILLILSGLAWVMEYGALYCLITGIGHKFSTTEFVTYMDSIFAGNVSEYVGLYLGINAVVLVMMAVVAYGRNFVTRKKDGI
ncbi:MAG: lysylphosphatidylglycerol synthase domain-containing protein [Lachnospiraceae bacterium]|jgi:hypothetical protein